MKIILQEHDDFKSYVDEQFLKEYIEDRPDSITKSPNFSSRHGEGNLPMIAKLQSAAKISEQNK